MPTMEGEAVAASRIRAEGESGCSTPRGATASASHRPADLAAVLALRRLADDADPAPRCSSACVI